MADRREMQIKCPFFRRLVKGNQMIGVECESPGGKDLGFDASFYLRLKTYRDLNDFTDIFCTDMWETCPYASALLKTKYRNDR